MAAAWDPTGQHGAGVGGQKILAIVLRQLIVPFADPVI